MSDLVRSEQDSLGRLDVPVSALWGIQTERARRTFAISGLRPLPGFVDAVVRIKRAAALTHAALGTLDPRLADAIVRAADEVLSGEHRDQFVVDPYQAGAGTSHHMNVNEVLANRANELLGTPRGSYAPVHPNDHVNQAQSTNDVIPTAIRLAILLAFPSFDASAAALEEAFAERGRAFDDVIKAGRTHLQDAMPIRLGQEFAAYAATIARGRARLGRALDDLRDLGIGGTAVGTGVNTEFGYAARIVQQLRDDTGLAVREGADRVQLMQSMGDVEAFHANLRVFASDLIKIADDLRLMASGPRTGLNEIRIPAVQPGSSIMPGKVNPSVVEMVCQVCLQVVGNDATVSAASAHGELELNVMMPVIAHNVLFSLTILGNALRVLADRCVVGIEANREQAAYWVERSAALATALAPVIGYAKAAELATRSVTEGVLIRDLVEREQVLPLAQLRHLLDLDRLTRGAIPPE